MAYQNKATASVRGGILLKGDFDGMNADELQLKVGAVGTAKIAADAVDSTKLADGAVSTAAKLATGVVETAKIAANAVDDSKLAANAVTSTKILAGAVGGAAINVALKPSGTAGVGDEALRAIGITGSTACAGDDARVNGALQRSGGTMTGHITLFETSPAAGSAVSKGYVDSLAQGLRVKPNAKYATSAALAQTYTYSAGTGADRLTASGTLAALSIDGATPGVDDIVLVKDEASANKKYNGWYKVIAVGSGAVAWVLERSVYVDTAAELAEGSFSWVEAGTANANTRWAVVTAPATLNTNDVEFTQISGAAEITAGSGLSKTGNTLSVATGGITSGMLADGTVATADIADGAITSAKILDGTIVDGDIASGTITAAKLVAGIQGAQIGAVEALRALGATPTTACAGDDGRLPTQGENDALLGTDTSTAVGNGNKYVTNSDARNTNSRAPNGSATGDLTGSYPAPTVASGAITAAKLASGAANKLKDVQLQSGTSYPILATDAVVAMGATAGAAVATLPTLTGNAGLTILVKRISVSNLVEVAPASGQSIDFGAANAKYPLNAYLESAIFVAVEGAAPTWLVF